MAEKVIRTIGVLTSGGDAPGMNAAIRAVVRTALGKGLKVRGIRRGYSGLLNEEIIDLSARDVSDTIQRGGTILALLTRPPLSHKDLHPKNQIKVLRSTCMC